MRNKKGVELSINTIIIIILAVIALVVLILILTGTMKNVIVEITSKLRYAFGLWNASQVK
jgi:hypothetical protein